MKRYNARMFIIKGFLLSKRNWFILFVIMLFLILVLANYFINLYILKNAINDLQVNAISNASKQIVKWTDEKINAVKNVETLIANMDHNQDKYSIGNLLQHGSSVAGFPYMFVGYEDNTIISSRTIIKPLTYNTISMPWYRETIRNEDITITNPYVSSIIDTLVVAVCSTTKSKRGQTGVVCGILPLEYIEKEILKISLPYDGNVFLLDKNKKILVHKDKEKRFKKFNQRIDKEGYLTVTKNSIFSQGFIKYGNWYLVSELNKEKVYERVDFQLKINLIIYGISLIIFLWLNLFYDRSQKRSDEKLKISKNLIKHFLSSDIRGCLIADDKDKITYYNNEFSKLLYLSENELSDNSLFECIKFFKRVPPWITDCIGKQLKATKEKHKTYTNTFYFFEKDKKVFLYFTSIPVLDAKKEYKGVIFFVEDVTKKEMAKKAKKEQEDILFQQTKMADLGEMIGAISHQWRQPLNSISLLIGNILQFKEMGCLSDEIFKDNLNRAISNAHYLSDTIDTFKNFYLPNRKIESFDIIEAIEDTKVILEPYLKNSGINIEILSEETHYNCSSYKNEFQQIIASLVLNARDAILEDKTIEKKYIKIIIKEVEEKYYLEVQDSGPGIDITIKEILFEAFKTTKGEKGTGNGLYLSRLIARDKLLGNLTVISYNNPTTFLFSFPKKIKEEND